MKRRQRSRCGTSARVNPTDVTSNRYGHGDQLGHPYWQLENLVQVTYQVALDRSLIDG